MKNQPHIWVVDDEDDIRLSICEFLQNIGCLVSTFSRANEVGKLLSQPKLSQHRVDLILTDIHMPGMSGCEFLTELSLRAIEIPVILMTGYASLDSAIECFKKGAYDYFVKPLKLLELKSVVEHLLESGHSTRRACARENLPKGPLSNGLIGASRKMREVRDTICCVAPTSANVLILGESGTGKEMVARALHDASPRAQKPFVAINCSAIPESLLESELFGYAKGAFTGAVQSKMGLIESANGGTLFLDEIGDMRIDHQAKLLRVIQERRVRPVGETSCRIVDVRIVAATHRDLKSAMRQGLFREDLFYRLCIVSVSLPALREREGDILLLAEHFLRKYAALHGLQKTGFTLRAQDYLNRYSWPGNVRELENVIERAVILSDEEDIDEKDLACQPVDGTHWNFNSLKEPLPKLENIEHAYIRYVLEQTGGNKERAAQILGINRRTIYRQEKRIYFETR